MAYLADWAILTGRGLRHNSGMLLANPLPNGGQTVEILPFPLLGSRPGPRPRTRDALPHMQLDQWPPPALVKRLLARSLSLPQVRTRQSRMASPETQALWVPDELARGPHEAYIDGYEFCHLHPLPEGSLHLTLPAGIRQQAIEFGWAESHLLARAGYFPDSLVMTYAPRNEFELDMVVYLVELSCNFAKGCF